MNEGTRDTSRHYVPSPTWPGETPDPAGDVPTPPNPPAESLTQKTVRGAMWNYVVYAGSKFTAFASSIVLARLLVPNEFGLLALALLALTYVDVLNEFGISAGVIYSDGDVDHNSNVGFLLSCITGVLAFLLVFFVAPIAADFFDEPKLTDILRVMSIAFLISSVASVHEARLRRRLSFKQRLGPELARSGMKAVVSIGLAVMGLGVWSLVWGQLASSATAAVGYWLREPWRPRPTWDSTVMWKLIKYGGGFMSITFLGVAAKDVDYLIIGRALNATELGIYSLGYRLPELVVMGATYAFSQTVFPAFARLHNDKRNLNRAFLKTIRTLALVTMPVGVGIAVVSNDFVHVLYGQKWDRTASVMPWIALATVVTAATFVTGDVYKATGRLRVLTMIGLARLPLSLVVLSLTVDRGIHAVAVAQLCISLVTFAIELGVAQRILGIERAHLVRSLSPAIFASTIMAAVCMTANFLLRGDEGTTSRLIAVSLLGGAVYAAVVGAFFRSTLRTIFSSLGRHQVPA